MKKSFLIALVSMLTLGLSNSVEAHYVSYDPWFDTVVITSPSTYGYVRPFYPAYTYYDPAAELMSTGIVASALSFALGVCGVAQVSKGLADIGRGYTSSENDGAELPRGVLTLSAAALVGALAVVAIQSATK